MQQIPRSDRTKAPDSITSSRVSGSRTTDAVRPTADDPFPEVYTPLGDSLCTYPSSCDLLVPGSPTRRMFMSPRLFNFTSPSSSSSSSNSGSSMSISPRSSISRRAFCRLFLLSAVPFFTFLELPPNSMHNTPFCTSSISQVDGTHQSIVYIRRARQSFQLLDSLGREAGSMSDLIPMHPLAWLRTFLPTHLLSIFLVKVG